MKLSLRLAYTCVSALLLAHAALAQSDVAAISGFVKDPSGAVIANANVTIKNESTGAERQVATSNSGYYVVTNLTPGVYTLLVQAAGFQRYSKTGNKARSLH
ncbi:MAG: hypothetical protein JWO80_674 [Bryobacterales bacterium]|nr:hypothetical protein [Bryobacterales bacterium]